MSYSTSTPPAMISQRLGGGFAWWEYRSADAIATVNTSGYFTNGAALGMKVGDIVIVTDTNVPTTSLAVVADVTAGGQADVADGTAITRTDSD
jgi:lipid-binding SYLF domain-containing protein